MDSYHFAAAVGGAVLVGPASGLVVAVVELAFGTRLWGPVVVTFVAFVAAAAGDSAVADGVVGCFGGVEIELWQLR